MCAVSYEKENGVCHVHTMYAANSDNKVDKGNLVTNLVFPLHAVDFAYKKATMMFVSRWIREVHKCMLRISRPLEEQKRSHIFLPAGSRTSSLRIPSISVFDEEGNKVRVVASDMDMMICHQDLAIGVSGGPLHLEFIPDPNNIGYGKVKVLRGSETMPDLFAPGIDDDGNNVQYLKCLEAVKYTIKDRPECNVLLDWNRSGPAFEWHNRATTYSDGHTMKVDVVVALMSAQSYFRQEIEEVMRRSNWSPEVQELLQSVPAMFVPVSPKTCQDDGMTWRISFSLHEVIVPRSLSANHRQIYMAIKYIIKYLVETTDIPENIAERSLSSYMTMNPFLAFCDIHRSRDWSDKKMETVYDFFRFFTTCLSQKFLPQYFYPKNNLLRDVTPEWCQYYAKLFSFSSESTVITFILEAQKSWRMPQFERSVYPFWSEEDMTLEKTFCLLTDLSKDALVHLPLVRIVQALWNHFQVYKNLILCPSRSQELSKVSRLQKKKETKFWTDLLQEMEGLVAENKVSKAKYTELMKLMQKMIPLDDGTLAFLEKKQNEQKSNVLQEDCELETYYKATYRSHGEIEDVSISFNNTNVTVQPMDDPDVKYVFPYTDHKLLYSEPLIFFLFCGKDLQCVHPEEAQKLVDDFVNRMYAKDTKYAVTVKDNPVIGIGHILKIAFCEDEIPRVCDILKYKVSQVEDGDKVVVSQQPRSVPWESTLFASCGRAGAGFCLATTFCTPCAVCWFSGYTGEHLCDPLCLCCCTTMEVARTKLRVLHNLEGDLRNDCLPLLCCPLCFMCQTKAEWDKYLQGK